MKAVFISFLETVTETELVAICDELKEKSYNGYCKKTDLIMHITKHYDFFEIFENEEMLPEATRTHCSSHKKRIERIIKKHQDINTFLMRNRMQATLIRHSHMGAEKWIMSHGKKFAELFDIEKYRDIAAIYHKLSETTKEV